MTLLNPVPSQPGDLPTHFHPPTMPCASMHAEPPAPSPPEDVVPPLASGDEIRLPVLSGVLSVLPEEGFAAPPAPPSTLSAPPPDEPTPAGPHAEPPTSALLDELLPLSERDTLPPPADDEAPDSIPGAFVAFVDCETTGLLPEKHEILEIAVVRADARTLAVLDECSIKVRPERIEDADPEALAVCGYEPEAWQEAVSLAEALARVTPLLEGATLAGHHVVFDRSFLLAAYQKTGVRPPVQPRHLLDTVSLGWPLYAQGLIPSLSLDELAGCAGAARPSPHRALDDARCARAVAAHLLRGSALVALADVLSPDEHALAELLLRRLATGRLAFGPGGSRRDYLGESMIGLVDAMQCLGAEIVRLGRGPDGRMPPVAPTPPTQP